MYIVAIAWIYVVFMMALTETSVLAGVLTFIFYGLVPLALFLWLFGTPVRRRRRREQERREALRQAGAANSVAVTEKHADQGDRSDPRANQ